MKLDKIYNAEQLELLSKYADVNKDYTSVELESLEDLLMSKIMNFRDDNDEVQGDGLKLEKLFDVVWQYNESVA